MMEGIYQIAEHYGYEKQSDLAVEEMAELIKAINKYKRKGFAAQSEERENLIEEIADVSIMIDQLMYLLQCESKVYGIKLEKIERTKAKMWEPR